MSRSKCPDCSASRGLAEYPDGTYCHACHVFKKERSLMTEEVIKKPELAIPEDLNLDWPDLAYDWFNQYQDLKGSSMMKHGYWSSEYQRIVFPSSAGKAAWMRSITEQPKWLFVGDKNDIFHYRRIGMDIPNSTNVRGNGSISIVEDVVSAIKVSEVMDCIPLGGTVLKENQYDFIRDYGYTKVYIFLDGDDAGKKGAQRIRNQLKLEYNCVIIRERLDPKEIPISGLKELLR